VCGISVQGVSIRDMPGYISDLQKQHMHDDDQRRST